MFSGIVNTISSIFGSSKSEGLAWMQVEKPTEFNDLKIGGSVAVNGACLASEAVDLNQIPFALTAKTLQDLAWRIGKVRCI